MANEDVHILGYICPICKTPNPKNVNYCTQCGQWLLNPNMEAKPLTKSEYKKYFESSGRKFFRKFVHGVIALLILRFCYILIVTPINPNNNIIQTNVSTKTQLEVIDSVVLQEGIFTYITGTVKNNTSKKFNFVQIDINLYDQAGNQVGNTSANTNNFEGNSKWKFKAPVLQNNIKTYKIMGVTGN